MREEAVELHVAHRSVENLRNGGVQKVEVETTAILTLPVT